MAEALTDEEVLAICLGEIELASGSSELANQRADAMDRYLGEPRGDEIEGRSQVITRETQETVDGLMPSLMRIFAEQENLIEFVPFGPEDEDQAEQETDVVNYIFWQENRGFFNLFTFCKDALLSKTGVLKCWADKSESIEREEYEGLDDLQLGQLMQDQQVSREVLEYELTEDEHHVVFLTTRDECKIRIMPIAPEEFGIERGARSPYVADAALSWCRFRKTIGELVQEGHDQDFLESLPADESIETPERIARRNISDEQGDWSSDKSMRTVWVTECYAKIDRDGDGLPELLKVTIAAGSMSGGELMDIEEIDAVPLFATPAVLITHKFYGLSIADLVMDLEAIQTALLRQVMDNTYLANNGMTAANKDYINIDDLLTRRPGGVVRVQGDLPWQQLMGPIPHNPLPQQTSELFERLDERQKRRTGYGDEIGALDTSALANVNTGVAALAFDMALAKIELLARIIAEIGLQPLFHHIHELMIKNKYRARALRLRNKWVQANPSNWRTRNDSRVTVGIGKVSRERKIMAHEAILSKQQELIAAGAMGTLLLPHHQYEAYKGWIEAWGFEPDMYLQDPRQLPPPPPKGPDPQQDLMKAQAQALMMDGQSKMARAQNEQQKLAIESKRLEIDMQYKQAEMLMRAQIERLKGEATELRSHMEVTGKVIDMKREQELRDNQSQLDALKLQLDHLNKTRDRDLEYYKTLTTAAVKGQMPETPDEVAAREADETAQAAAAAQKEMDRQMREGNRDAALVQMFNEIRAYMDRDPGPKVVEYDDKGLMRAIGGKAVTRDNSGKVIQIG